MTIRWEVFHERDQYSPSDDISSSRHVLTKTLCFNRNAEKPNKNFFTVSTAEIKSFCWIIPQWQTWSGDLYCFFHAVHLAFHGRASFPSIHSITKQQKSAVNGICPPRLFVWKLVNSVMWTQKYSRDRALNFLPPLFYLLNYINNTKIFTVSLKSNGKSLMRWWVHELSLVDNTMSMLLNNIKTAGHNWNSFANRF